MRDSIVIDGVVVRFSPSEAAIMREGSLEWASETAKRRKELLVADCRRVAEWRKYHDEPGVYACWDVDTHSFRSVIIPSDMPVLAVTPRHDA